MSVITNPRSRRRLRASAVAAITPSSVAATPLTAATSALRSNAEVSSVLVNAALNHFVEKLLIGSVGMLPLLNAKTTRTTSGA